MRSSITIAGSLAATSLFLVMCGDAHRPLAVAPLTTAEPPPAQATSAEAPPPPVVTTPLTEPTTLSEADQKRDAETAAKVAPIVDAWSNVDARLTHDGKRVVYRSNRDGVWQLYVADASKPGEAAKKLTSSADRVAEFDLTPDDKYAVFTSDEGADENFRIYRVALDGSAMTTLTPGEKMRRVHPVVARRRSVMVYAAAQHGERAERVIVQSTDGGEAKVVYTDPFPGAVVDVDPQGAQALFLRTVSASEKVLLRIDLASGRATRLYPEEGRQVTVSDAAFSADGKRIFIGTDDGTDAAYVFAIDAGAAAGSAPPSIKARFKEDHFAAASVDSVHASEVGEKLAVTVNAGNRSEVRILDARTLKKIADVKTPLGTAWAVGFSADGLRVPITLSTPERPAEILLADAATGAVKPLRDESHDKSLALAPIEVDTPKIPAHDGLRIPLNVYLPKPRTGKLPVIVSVHGGPAGSYRVQWRESTRWWTSQGYAVVEPNVRGSTGFGRAYEKADNKEKRVDAFKDLETVNKWVRAQAWADPDRIVVMGGSYGGYMVLIALTRQQPLWAAGVDMFGVSNLRSLFRTTSAFIRSILTDEFGDLDKEGALLDEYSPLQDAAKISVPLFVYAGANDARVPKSESDAVVAAARAGKLPVEYMLANNEGHSLDRRENRVAFLARVTRFLGDRLKK